MPKTSNIRIEQVGAANKLIHRSDGLRDGGIHLVSVGMRADILSCCYCRSFASSWEQGKFGLGAVDNRNLQKTC